MARLLRLSPALLPLVGVLSASGCDALFGEPTADVTNPNQYDAAGIRFAFPGNWTLTQEADTIDEITMTTITVESRGDALAIVQQFRPGVPVDADDVMTKYTESMRQSLADTVGGIAELRETSVTNVNHQVLGKPQTGRRKAFFLSLLGEKVDHTCDVYPIELETRSIIVYLQAPDDALAKAAPGFDQILDTLTVEDN